MGDVRRPSGVAQQWIWGRIIQPVMSPADFQPDHLITQPNLKCYVINWFISNIGKQIEITINPTMTAMTRIMTGSISCVI